MLNKTTINAAKKLNMLSGELNLLLQSLSFFEISELTEEETQRLIDKLPCIMKCKNISINNIDNLNQCLLHHKDITDIELNIYNQLYEKYDCGHRKFVSKEVFRDQFTSIDKCIEKISCLHTLHIEKINVELMTYSFSKEKNNLAIHIVMTKYTPNHSMCRVCKPFYNNGKYRIASVDNLFHSMVWSHGLATGYLKKVKGNTVINNLKKIINNNNMQLCCTHKTQHLGPIGVFVQGHVDFASNADLMSDINSYGDRVFVLNKDVAETLVYKKDKIDLSYPHMEVIVNHPIIKALWVKESELNAPFVQKALKNWTGKVYIIK